MEETDLASVVDVMEGDTENHFGVLADEGGVAGVSDGGDKFAMFGFEKLAKFAPRRFAGGFWRGEPIASLDAEGATLFTEQASTCNIFPVRSVDGEFPNIVASALWTPNSGACGYAAKGLLEVRAVPGFLLVGFGEESKEQSRVCVEMSWGSPWH